GCPPRGDVAQGRRRREGSKACQELGPRARWRRARRGRLAAAAPVWPARILADPAAAGDPADIDAAWQWRQLDCWVRQALGGQTPAQLQARLEELSVRRRRGIAELGSERAWRRLAGNLRDPQPQGPHSLQR